MEHLCCGLVYYADEGLLEFLFSACPLVCVSVRGSYHPAGEAVLYLVTRQRGDVYLQTYLPIRLSLRLPGSHIVILVTKWFLVRLPKKKVYLIVCL